MPIVLAIEPDRRQAAHLSAIVRHRVSAELILADTTEGALDAIGGRVPDLVLVPALISPQDDAALAAALRVIATAAHVRILTTPVFSNGTKRAQGDGLFSRLGFGRQQQAPATDGCDPAVFAEQISDYLREAAEERAELEADSDFNQLFAEEPVVASPPVAAPPKPLVREREMFASFNKKAGEERDDEPVEEFAEPEAYAAAPSPVDRHIEAPAPMPASTETEPAPATDLQPATASAAASPFDFVETANEIFAKHEARHEAFVEEQESDDVIVIDLSNDITEMSPAPPEPAPGDATFDGEPLGVYTLPPLEKPIDSEVEAFERFVKADETAPVVEPLAAPAAPAAAAATAAHAAAEIDEPEPRPVEEAPWISLGLRHTLRWPVIEGVAVEPTPAFAEFTAGLVDDGPRIEDAAPMPAPVATPPSHRADHLDWKELVASLRQDIERRRHQPPAAAALAAALAKRPTEPKRPAEPVPIQSRRPKKPMPAQDEWGFFDPQQCGFAALLAKLDEFGDDDPKSRRRS